METDPFPHKSSLDVVPVGKEAGAAGKLYPACNVPSGESPVQTTTSLTSPLNYM